MRKKVDDVYEIYDIYTQAAVTYLSRKPFIGTGTSLPRLQKPWKEANVAEYEPSVLMHCV